MIIDCFIFYNELKMLSFRLKELNENVDYFVIVESKHTFSGKEKKLYFEENKELFKEYLHKIIHIIVSDFPYKYPDIELNQQYIKMKEAQQWINENHQRRCIDRGIKKLDLNDEDIIIISDCDEIPDINNFFKLLPNKINEIYSLEMDMYYYNLTNKLIDPWKCSKIVPFKIYKNINDPQIIRDPEFENRNNEDKTIKSGWHFSYFFDIDLIINKIKMFAHQEFNKEEYLCKEKIDELIKSNKDIFFREDVKMEKIEIKNNNYLPKNYKMLL
jgi:beta-1,4-mannosyl-glycoprotein beta-1,4-N-acetylglucosaminyltransferase